MLEYLYPPSPPEADGFVILEWLERAASDLPDYGWLGDAEVGAVGYAFLWSGTNGPPDSPAMVRVVDEATALSTGPMDYLPSTLTSWYWLNGSDAVSVRDRRTVSESELMDESAAGLRLRDATPGSASGYEYEVWDPLTAPTETPPAPEPTETAYPPDPIFTSTDALARCVALLPEGFVTTSSVTRLISEQTLETACFGFSSSSVGLDPDRGLQWPVWLVGLEVPGFTARDAAMAIRMDDPSSLPVDGLYCALDAPTGLHNSTGAIGPA